MKLLILGGTGMLGHKLWQIFSTRTETYATIRQNINAYAHWNLYDPAHTFEHVSAQDFDGVLRVICKAHPDVIVNCIGIVKQQQAAKDPLLSIAINALFPHRLAEVCAMAGIRLIHISTDCVFSGHKGNYLERDNSDAEDVYGRTKFLGEVDQPGCLTIRTSMIGYELDGTHGLLEWFLSQKGKSTRGFTNAIFSGFTTTALADILWSIVTRFPTLDGLYHIAAQPIDKYALLSRINQVLMLGINIVPDSSVVIDRSLNGQRFAQAASFIAPGWDKMIQDLAAEAAYYEKAKPHNVHR